MAIETIEQTKARRTREMIEWYGTNKAEIEGLYDEAHWYNEWWTRVVRPAAERGEIIDAEALDALDRHNRRYLAHDYSACIPRGYVLPEFR